MSEETRSFICRNPNCSTDNSYQPDIIYYDLHDARSFACPSCNYNYVRNEEQVLLNPAGDYQAEIIFNTKKTLENFIKNPKGVELHTPTITLQGIDAILGFIDQNQGINLYIPKLIIKDIKDDYYDNKIISFGKCRFGKLILENIDITAAFYPFSFSECKIRDLSIKNCRIRRSGLKDFYGAWSYYGFNLFKTQVSENFILDEFESSVAIVDSDLKCKIEIKNKSKVKLASLHNKHEIKVKTDNSSTFLKLFEAAGKSTKAGSKKKTSDQIIDGQTIDELIIDPTVESKVVIKNCSISKIILPEDRTIKSQLYFYNCFIEKMDGQPHGFSKDVIFLGCTFAGEFSFLRTSFQQSLILEACSFHKRLLINDLSIENDLHLNYSSFKEGYYVSMLNSRGYFNSQFVNTEDKIGLENCQIGRDVIFRNMHTSDDFIIKNCEISGNLSCKRLQIGKDAEFKWINVHDVSLDDIYIKGSTNMISSSLKGTLVFDCIENKGNVDFTFLTVHGNAIFSNSLIEGTSKWVYSEISMLFFSRMDFKNDFNIENSDIRKLSDFSENCFKRELEIKVSKFNEFNVKYNRVSSFLIENSVTGKLNFDDNLLSQHLHLSASVVSELIVKDQYIAKELILSSSDIKDITVSKTWVGIKTQLSYINAEHVSITDNRIFQNFDINELKANNLFFTNNQVMAYPTVVRNEDWQENRKGQEVALVIKNLFANNFHFYDNYIHIPTFINQAELNDVKIIDNLILNSLVFNAVEGDKLGITSNKVKQLTISNGEFSEIEFKNCNFPEKLKLNNVTISKDLSFNECKLESFLSILYCSIGRDLDFKSTICVDDFVVRNCKVGNSINVENCIFHEALGIMENTINNSINIEVRYIRHEFRIHKNLIEGNILLKDTHFLFTFLIKENAVGQQCIMDNIKVGIDTCNLQYEHSSDQIIYAKLYNYQSPEPVKFEGNNFNFVSFKTSSFYDTLYFDKNVVLGSLKWGERDSDHGFAGIIFNHPVSMRENRIRRVEFNELAFREAACLHNNHVEAGVSLFNTDFQTAIDFTGSFIGGTFSFDKRDKKDDGHLILNNTYIDKRIRFVQTSPKSISFINATFNDFDIPGYWKMRGKKLINESTGNLLFRELSLKKTKIIDEPLPYNMIKSYCDRHEDLSEMATQWTGMQWKIFDNKGALDFLVEQIPDFEVFLERRNLIDECISKKFIPVYYEFYTTQQLAELYHLTGAFASSDTKFEDQDLNDFYERFKNFCEIFKDTLNFYYTRKIVSNNEDVSKIKSDLNDILNENLQEQYKVLRQIYGSNGELENEDRAYYWWKHYLNINEMQGAKFTRKLRNGIKLVLYETIFGWGVNLPRILISTLAMVTIFTLIYFFMFWSNPMLEIQWDGTGIKGGTIDIWWTAVLALQTTFSAVLGDWAPIGSGAIKIPMTINAILGVLFVTFMIGAYGRKMLR